MGSKQAMALVLAVAAFMAIGPASAVSRPHRSASTSIKSTQLDNVTGGRGDYSGVIGSTKERCLKNRKIRVIHVSDPEFVFGETPTDDDGEWGLNGPVPPAKSPQVIRIEVVKADRCKGKSKTYPVSDLVD